MIQFAATANFLRPRNGHGSAPVTQIELFFDLVFVFTVIQLSAELRAQVSALGLVQTLMLFAAVWWVWVYTSWVTNWLDPEHRPVQLMLIVLMSLSLLLSTALPEAFGERGFVFAAAYVAIQLGRSIFMLWAVRRHDNAHYQNMRRIAVWLMVSGVFWLAGSFRPDGERMVAWLIALALDIAAPALDFYVPRMGHSTVADWSIDSYHVAERFGAFILIALGESIIVTGETFYKQSWTALDGSAFLAAFICVAALWWIYFDEAAERTAHVFAQSDNPGWIARAAYTYVHGLLVLGIIAVAAGNGVLLEHPTAPVSLATGLMIIGGPALYLLGNGVFRRLLYPRFPRSHVLGLLLLAMLVVMAPYLSMLALAWALVGVLAVVIAWSDFALLKQTV